MTKQLKYTIFHVKWGHFGLLSGENALLRTSLPSRSARAVKAHLLAGLEDAKREKALERDLQERITAYFEGTCVNFSDVRLDLSHLTPFTRRVLRTCRKIRYSQTITYGQLAQMTHSPHAARAVGNILAKNPLPLIIPCHRIIRSDGSPGGFTAPQGTKLKLLKLEKKSTIACL